MNKSFKNDDIKKLGFMGNEDIDILLLDYIDLKTLIHLVEISKYFKSLID